MNQSVSDFSYDGRGSIIVIADDATAGDEAAEAVTLAGARVADRAGLHLAIDRVVKQARVDGVIIEMRGADDHAIDDLLTRIDILAREAGFPVVVSLETAQIDRVAAQLFGAHVTLLCEPTVAERIAALTIARMTAKRIYADLHDEAERLRVLNAKVAEIADTLTRLIREGDDVPSRAAIRDTTVRFDSDERQAPRPVTSGEVRAAIRARRLRANHFAGELFADPAWDMLLDLFAADLEHRRVSVSSLCIAAAVPGTTALRWIGTMVETGLFERHADPLDRRRAYISLTDSARTAMHGYFGALRRAGLAPA